MRQIPQGHIMLKEKFCSNLDQNIDDNVVEKLKTTSCYAPYYAWDWYGDVWFEENKFHCRVMAYGNVVGTVCAETPEELVRLVSDKYGRD